MLNNFILVGRIYDIFNDKIIINVTKQYKNEYGEYEKYLISIEVSHDLLGNVKEYCKIGDTIGVKGHIGNENTLIAEKVTFLSSKK